MTNVDIIIVHKTGINFVETTIIPGSVFQMRSLSVEFPLNRTDYNDFKHEFLSILSNTNMEYMLFKIYIYLIHAHLIWHLC